MDRLFHRFPHAVVALDCDLRVVAMNEQARFLVEDDLIRAGEPLHGELGSLAARLAVDPEPQATTALQLAF